MVSCRLQEGEKGTVRTSRPAARRGGCCNTLNFTVTRQHWEPPKLMWRQRKGCVPAADRSCGLRAQPEGSLLPSATPWLRRQQCVTPYPRPVCPKGRGRAYGPGEECAHVPGRTSEDPRPSPLKVRPPETRFRFMARGGVWNLKRPLPERKKKAKKMQTPRSAYSICSLLGPRLQGSLQSTERKPPIRNPPASLSCKLQRIGAGAALVLRIRRDT